MITSLRSLVRFLEFGQSCPAGLSHAWPTVPNWQRSSIPTILSRKECQNLLRAADDSTSRVAEKAEKR
jgi:hypothetical protein